MMKKEVVIMKHSGAGFSSQSDEVAVEKPVTLLVNGIEMITLLCSPGHLDELAVGFLAGEGLLSHDSEDLEVQVDEEAGLVNVASASLDSLDFRRLGRRCLTTGCGKGVVFYDLRDRRDWKKVESSGKISPEKILSVMGEMQGQAVVFRETGGVHSAGLLLPNHFIIREDVGRHNAVDKLLGFRLLHKIDYTEGILFLSGRISSEIVLKAGRMGIPVLVSRAAPTSLACELSEELGVTLVGFVRGKRMNVYTHAWRIE